jgi:hypothetical protein
MPLHFIAASLFFFDAADTGRFFRCFFTLMMPPFSHERRVSHSQFPPRFRHISPPPPLSSRHCCHCSFRCQRVSLRFPFIIAFAATPFFRFLPPAFASPLFFRCHFAAIFYFRHFTLYFAVMPPPCHLTAFRHAFADAMPLRHAMLPLFFDAFCHYFMPLFRWLSPLPPFRHAIRY